MAWLSSPRVCFVARKESPKKGFSPFISKCAFPSPPPRFARRIKLLFSFLGRQKVGQKRQKILLKRQRMLSLERTRDSTWGHIDPESSITLRAQWISILFLLNFGGEPNTKEEIWRKGRMTGERSEEKREKTNKLILPRVTVRCILNFKNVVPSTSRSTFSQIDSKVENSTFKILRYRFS